MQEAKRQIIKIIQNKYFRNEITHLRKTGRAPNNSRLKYLQPFLDDDIIRVGGRLKNSDIKFDQKHPIILPSEHRIAQLIIEYTHKKNFHSGPELTLALLRQEYWILGARNRIKKLPKSIEHEMGDLPDRRVNKARPFSNCGVDYGGPIYIKQGGTRSKILVKAYIALFVCLATKAIHIELVTSLSADSFISALKRLIGQTTRPPL